MRMPQIARNARVWTCLISATLVLGGCSTIKTSPTVHTANIDAAQVNESAHVYKGQTLTVQLPTQGGASYMWRLEPASLHNGLLTLDQRKGQQRNQGGLARSGEPAWDIFVFKARHTGQVTLNFFYDRASIVNAVPAQQLALNVDVTRPDKSTALASGE